MSLDVLPTIAGASGCTCHCHTVESVEPCISLLDLDEPLSRETASRKRRKPEGARYKSPPKRLRQNESLVQDSLDQVAHTSGKATISATGEDDTEQEDRLGQESSVADLRLRLLTRPEDAAAVLPNDLGDEAPIDLAAGSQVDGTPDDMLQVSWGSEKLIDDLRSELSAAAASFLFQRSTEERQQIATSSEEAWCALHDGLRLRILVSCAKKNYNNKPDQAPNADPSRQLEAVASPRIPENISDQDASTTATTEPVMIDEHDPIFDEVDFLERARHAAAETALQGHPEREDEAAAANVTNTALVAAAKQASGLSTSTGRVNNAITSSSPAPQFARTGSEGESKVSTQEQYEKARALAASREMQKRLAIAASNGARRPWTTDEEDALMHGIDYVKGPHWAQILALWGVDGMKGTILKDRTQVQLKDKARNLKLYFLKNNQPVPPYMEHVTGELKTRAPPRYSKEDAASNSPASDGRTTPEAVHAGERFKAPEAMMANVSVAI